MAQVPWSGRMAAATLASGVGASSMAEEHITMASSPRKACGRWVDGRRQGPFHRLSRSAFRSCYCWLLPLLLIDAFAVVVAVAVVAVAVVDLERTKNIIFLSAARSV